MQGHKPKDALSLGWLLGCTLVILLSVAFSAALVFADQSEAVLNRLQEQGCFSQPASDKCEELRHEYETAYQADEAATRPWMVAYLTSLAIVSLFGVFVFLRTPRALSEVHDSQQVHPRSRTYVRSVLLIAGVVVGLLAAVLSFVYWEHAPIIAAIARAGLSIFVLSLLALIGLGIGALQRHLRGWLSSPDSDAPQSNPKAIASMVFGISGIILIPFILPITAIVLGNRARRELTARPQDTGAGFAVAGVMLGWLGIVLDILLTFVLLILLAG